MQIPKIIHQTWSGIDEPLPEHFQILGNTWKRDYPEWQYEFLDNSRMENFIKEHYPEYWNIYCNFPYNIQRWDAVRYLILDKIGGMYADFDYESLKPMDDLLKGKSCCFALEPEHQYLYFKKNIMFNNALMASVSNHPFIKKLIAHSFSHESLNYKKEPKRECVLNTTGPFMMIDLYEALSPIEKQEIYLIPSKYATPLDGFQSKEYLRGTKNKHFENALSEAYAVHYFVSAWD